MSSDNEKKSKKYPIWLFLAVAAIMVAVYYLLVRCFEPSIQNRGLFGDTFGALTSFVSGGALIGVVLSLFYQRKEFDLQKQELQMTREEMKRQADAQEQSKKALEEQVKAMGRTALITAYTYMAEYHERMEQEAIRLHAPVEGRRHRKEADTYRNGMVAIRQEIEWLSDYLKKDKKTE